MDIKNRRQNILDILAKTDYVTVESLAKALDVSVVTIRTDLTYLEDQKLLIRTHGGAMKPEKKSTLRYFSNTIYENEKEKTQIAKIAASLVSDKSTIIIDSGSTAAFFANCLKGKNITVVTNSVPVTDILKDEKTIEMLILGGNLQRSTMGSIGPMANAAVNSLNVDLYFLGAAAYDEDVITSSNMVESELKRAMIKAANKVVFLADSSKFGKRAFSTVCSWDDIDTFITDSISPSFKQVLEERGIEVIIPDTI